MARAKYDAKDFSNMQALQGRLAEVLLRANREGVHSVLAVFAMLRLCRELMHKIPQNERQALIDQVLIPFIQGEQAEGEGGRLITLH